MWLSLASLAMAFVSITTGWDRLMTEMPRGESGWAVAIMAMIIFAVPILLLWLIAWRRSNVARWIYVAVHGLDLIIAPFRPAAALHWGPFWTALTLGQYGCIALCLWMLFRGDARDWFAGIRPVDPDIFS